MAEHRRMQRGALLDAARSLLSEGGVRSLTFPALAERTGLARSSVYEYFRSTAELVEVLCEADLPLWAAEVEAAMAATDTPAGKIAAYVRHQLTLAADGRHRAVMAIAAGELDAAARAGTRPDAAWERIRAAHGGLDELVVGVLAELGHRDPRLAARLLQGVIDAAVRYGPGEGVAEAAVRMALRAAGADPGLPVRERDAADGQEPDRPGA
ncbi:TetR/AcrR family transcriptional regulator [Streptomyces sp. 8K308]|uniref:TetR/AcrR family transcriptional regulator n=1 Tax=Streptomyces sp. 8K308 TaxID=2530388 RepID=UPI001046C0B7|nr:TetR/AcrR family transcriptional regulator [Streptomyces sp. 8K308]TDC22734.1 TetR/AcrR family transcriptional regulator [Streptomyces sp. 8K308]